MKTIIIILMSLFFASTLCYSQLTPDYPFKTYLDENNNLYITGSNYNDQTNSIDLWTAKYSNGNRIWRAFFNSPIGIDRGLDLAVDVQGNVVATGYVFNSATSSNDIILLSYNSNGIYQWHRIISNSGDDKGMGLDITIDGLGRINEIFISGYITNTASGKDFFTAKYSSIGDLIWQRTYDENNVDNVATDIHLDLGYAYVSGYTREKDYTTNDFMLLSYWKENGDLSDSIIYNKPGSNELPAQFIISNKSEVPVQKSKSSVICVTDNLPGTGRSSNYLTLFFDEDINHDLQVRWANLFSNGPGAYVNVPTSIASDLKGNIYVTGYCNNFNNSFQSNGLDFATIKYAGENGKYAWKDKVKFFNYNDTSTTGVDDKASSVRSNNIGDLFVAGSCQGSPYGFSFAKYKGISSRFPTREYSRPFVPSFIADNNNGINLNKGTKLEIASDGSPLLIVMGWNENYSYWAAQKFTINGEVEYTIDPNQIGDNDYIKSMKTTAKVKLENSPNPFNPSTVISFNLTKTDKRNFVQLIVFDMLGREVQTLVNDFKDAGSNKAVFNAAGLSSGIYYYTLIVDGISAVTKSMVLVK
ncbi:MAG: T9SS type A sorting domain-containing protein [Ignavibacteria bacterium]